MANLFKNKYYRRCQGDTWWWIRYRDANGKDRRERAAPTKREAGCKVLQGSYPRARVRSVQKWTLGVVRGLLAL